MDLDLDVQHRPRSGGLYATSPYSNRRQADLHAKSIRHFCPYPSIPPNRAPLSNGPTGARCSFPAALAQAQAQRSCSPPFSARPAEALTDHSTMAGRCFALRDAVCPAKRPPTALRRLRPSPIRPTRCVAAHWLPRACDLVSCLSKRPSWSQIQLAPRSKCSFAHAQPATPVASPAADGLVTFILSP